MIRWPKFLNRNGRAGNGQVPDETVIIPDDPDEVMDTTTLLKSLQAEAAAMNDETSQLRQDTEIVERPQDVR